MRHVHLEQLDLRPAVAYIVALVFGAMLWWRGMNRTSVVLALAVLVTTAALPIGANVFIFSQRYGVAQPSITAGVAVSALLALVSVSLALLLAGRA